MEPVYAFKYFESTATGNFGKVGLESCEPMLGLWVPQGAHLTSMRYDGLIYTEDEDLADFEHTMFQLNVGVLPTVGSDTILNTSLNAMNVAWDKTFPKVDATAPGMPWTPSVADQEQGDRDTQLMFQPGRLSLSMLTDPNTSGQMLLHERMRLGFLEGTGFKTGDGKKSRLVARIGGMKRLDTTFAYNSDILWHWTNPADFEKEWQDIDDVLPRSNKYSSLQFLAPTTNALDGIPSILPSTSDDYREFLVSYHTTGTRQWVQHSIAMRMEVTYFFSRMPRGSIVEDTTT